MKNWPWPKISKIVTICYCLVSLLSVTLTYVSAIYRSPLAFQIGNNVLTYFWVFNPIGLIVPMMGAAFTGEKKRYLWHVVFNTSVWLLCSVSMASLY